jgi:hypothetical protein
MLPRQREDEIAVDLAFTPSHSNASAMQWTNTGLLASECGRETLKPKVEMLL